jgi:hypothetical protein
MALGQALQRSDKVVARMEEFAKDDPEFWKPAGLLAKLAAEGGKFQ